MFPLLTGPEDTAEAFSECFAEVAGLKRYVGILEARCHVSWSGSERRRSATVHLSRTDNEDRLLQLDLYTGVHEKACLPFIYL